MNFLEERRKRLIDVITGLGTDLVKVLNTVMFCELGGNGG